MYGPSLTGRSVASLLTGTIALSLLAAVAHAQTTTVASAGPAQPPAVAAAVNGYDTSAFAALEWREIGPFRGGRSVAVAGSKARPFEYWMGTTGGGVFKTTDGGITWNAVTDKYFGGTIGAIGVSESNPDVVYVGGGEYPIRGNVSHGDGVWKTTDGGKTWKYAGLADTRQISRVKVHPTNPDLVYVGAQGHVWAPNAERGVYRSKDGGNTWQKILHVHDSAGVTDLVMDPSNPDVLYAGFWQAGRTPWMLVSGGPHSGIWKSTNGGDSWTDITRAKGLPSGTIGNIGLSVSAAKPSRVWAIVEADSGGVFLSDDGGATWKRTNDERKLRQRAWYYTRIFADTKDTNTVYVLNVSFWKSTDGGKTFKSIRTKHGDSHDLWIAPDDNKRLIEGNDGGANVTFNGGDSWSDQDFATAQMYHVTTTNEYPYQVCGSQQDNSTICIPSRHPGGITMAESYDAGGCESGYIAVRPDKPAISFAGCYGGYLGRMDRETGFEQAVTPWPENPMGHSAGDLRYRFQWTYPIVHSPHDPDVLYAAGNVLFRTTNEGKSWTVVSPDLTRNDPKTLGPSGGPITKDQTSVEYYATIFAFAESPVTRGVLWAGSDDGLIHISRDNGKSWTKVTPRDMGDWTRVSWIDPSPHDAGTAYVAGNRFQLDDNRPYLWKTTDYGRTWTRIDAGIAPTEFTRVIREDPVRKGLLYAGTERGVWVSFDAGASWQRLQRNLPPVPVHDLQIRDGDLIAGTHGRSFWILDDLSVLRQITPQIAAKESHLFEPRTAYRTTWGQGRGNSVGKNPPSGAVVYYHLKEAHPLVTLEFLDRSGKVIRKFTSEQDSSVRADSLRADSVQRVRRDSLAQAGITPDSLARMEQRGAQSPVEEEGRRPDIPPRVANKQGLNSFVWNLRHPDAVVFQDMILWAGTTSGPVALPGTYTVRMTVNGGTPQSQTFELKADPRSTATQSGLVAQFEMLEQIRDRLSDANRAVRTIRNVRHQVEDRTPRVGGARAAEFRRAADALMTALTAVEDSLYQTKNRSNQDPLNFPIRLNNRIAALTGVVSSAEGEPTAQSREVFGFLSKKLDGELARMKRAMDSDLPKVNAVLRAANLPAIVPSDVEIVKPKDPVVAGGDAGYREPRRW